MLPVGGGWMGLVKTPNHGSVNASLYQRSTMHIVFKIQLSNFFLYFSYFS